MPATIFKESILVEGSTTFKATKIHLSKTISNALNSYHIRIQTYQLHQKIDGEIVFILQLKYTPTTDTSTNKQSLPLFFDQIWLQHKSKAFLESTVNIIFRAFDCDGFIQYNQYINQFEFNFEANQNLTTLTKYISLSRKKYTKKQVEILLKHRFDAIKPIEIKLQCINGHEIKDEEWDFEVNLTLKPGTYCCYIDELFTKVPLQLHARDSLRIRKFYEAKLKEFVVDAKIFDKYLKYLSKMEPRDRIIEWSKNKCATGPLFCLYSILLEMDENDSVWYNLFQICLTDEYNDKIIRNGVGQQTLADFIALSLKYYVQDIVKQKHQRKPIVSNEENILSEYDRYILSVVLPYFFSPGLETIHESIRNESLTSGLFNHFCEPLKIENTVSSAKEKNIDDDNVWCMKVSPLELKNKLLRHLHVEQGAVAKQYYVATWKYDRMRWTFCIRSATHSEIYSTIIIYGYFRKYVENNVNLLIPNDIILEILKFYNRHHNVDLDRYTFMDDFEFKQRNISSKKHLNLILKCIDVSHQYDWAMWTRKKLKLYTSSLGYWRLLSISDDPIRVPVDHLDSILTLLRHEAVCFLRELLQNKNEHIFVVFLKKANIKTFSMNDNNGTTIFNSWSEADVESEYQLTFWNGKVTGNSSLSLTLIKAAHPTIDRKKKLKRRESHFIHYKSTEDIEWRWYGGDCARYMEFGLGPMVLKQMEAAYQGVSEEMFPLQQFNRENRSDGIERTFNCPQLHYMSAALVEQKGFVWKPVVLRFTFHKHGGKIINIEWLKINSYYDQFPRNVRRLHSRNSDAIIYDEEQRVSCLGEMNIDCNQSDELIIIHWKFKQNVTIGLPHPYHYKLQIPAGQQIVFKRVLDCWRSNILFDQIMRNGSMIIVPSKLWKRDTKMPSIMDMTPLMIISGYIRECNIDKNVPNDIIKLLLLCFSS